MSFFDLPFIKCGIEFDLSRSKNWVIPEIHNTSEIDTDPNSDLPIPHAPANSTSSALFQINSAKLCVPVVTFFINNNIKVLKNIQQGFKRTSSEITKTTKKQQFAL